MKTLLILSILVALSISLYSMPVAWTQFQKDIGIQAAQFKDSPEHQQIRNSRDSRTYVVGDTHTFWRWNLAVMPPTWIQTPATCRAVGEHCYIFVANDQWNIHMTQANVDSALVRLEQNTPNNPDTGAIMMDVNLFGPIPDELDNDPKLIVFYSALGSFQGTSFDGYFSAYNQVTEAQAQMMNPPGHSNECEMIYMTCYPLNPVQPIRLSVLAHELEHLIHWGQDANEESWIDEGCAELAMVAYGVPDPISGFPSNPDNNLTVWNQQFADYVKVMLFFTYLKEHYDSTGMIRDLVADPMNGMNSLNSQVSIHYPQLSTDEILHNWSIANALDSPQPGDGLYNYEELDLPNFTMTNITLPYTSYSGTVQPFASDYIRYSPTQNTGLTLVSGSGLYLSQIAFDSSGTCTEFFPAWWGYEFAIPPISFNSVYSIFVITNTNATTATYNYVTTFVANEDNTQSAPAVSTLNCYPNPFSSTVNINYSLKNTGHTTLNIYNTKGQLVRKLIDESKSANQYEATWSGDSDADKSLPSGIYFIRLQNGSETKVQKVLLLK